MIDFLSFCMVPDHAFQFEIDEYIHQNLTFNIRYDPSIKVIFGVMSGDLGGQVMLQSCGPPLLIHRPGRFSFNQLRTFVDQCGGAPSCMMTCSFEFLSLPNLRMNRVYRITRSPFTLFSKKKGPTIPVKPIAAHTVIFGEFNGF